jgi:hypothetical protein
MRRVLESDIMAQKLLIMMLKISIVIMEASREIRGLLLKKEI